MNGKAGTWGRWGPSSTPTKKYNQIIHLLISFIQKKIDESIQSTISISFFFFFPRRVFVCVEQPSY